VSIFNIDDDLKAFLTRTRASLDRVDVVALEAQHFLIELRTELAEIKALRERVQAALGPPPHA